jgi:thiamine-phosphate pyrophosphorylase
MMKTNPTQPLLRGLYVITHERLAVRQNGAREYSPQHHETVARAAIKGGAGVVQLRDKTHQDAELLPVARRIAAFCRQRGAIFLVNDRVPLALACGADGVHLGPDDMAPDEARRVLGSHALIGLSCGTVEEALTAQICNANYIGVGAVFSTFTKADAGAPIGLSALRAICDATSLPVAAIGGVNLGNIASCIEQGAQMACVVSAVAGAGDEAAMSEAARVLAAKFEPKQDAKI